MRFLVFAVFWLMLAGPSRAQPFDSTYIKKHRIKTIRVYYRDGELHLGERYKYDANGDLTEYAGFGNYSFYFTGYKYDRYRREIESSSEYSGNNEVNKVITARDKDGNIVEEHMISAICDSIVSDDVFTRKYSDGRKVWEEKIVQGKPVMRWSAEMKDTLLTSTTQQLFYDTGYAITKMYFNANNTAWKTGTSSSHATDTTWSYVTRNGIVYYKQRPGNPALIYEPLFDHTGKLEEEFFHTPDSTIVRVCRYRSNGTVLLDSVHYKTGQVRVWRTDVKGNDSIYYDASKGSYGNYITYYIAYILDEGGNVLSSVNYNSQLSSVSLMTTSAKQNRITKESFTISYAHGYRAGFSFDPYYYINNDFQKVKEYRITGSLYKNGKIIKEKTRRLIRVKNKRYENSKPFSFRQEKLKIDRSRTRCSYDANGNLVKQRSGKMFDRNTRKNKYDKNGLLLESTDMMPGLKNRTIYTYEFYDPH